MAEAEKLREIPGSLATTVGKPENPAFDLALADFVTRFSIAETSTLFVLAKVSKLDMKVLKAIVYPLRVESAINSIRRVIIFRKLRGKGISELLQSLEQLAKINKFRNDLLHMGALTTDTKPNYHIISNNATAFNTSVRRTTEVSSIKLRRLSHDLNIILTIWVTFIGPTVQDDKKKLRVGSSWNDFAKTFRKRVPLGTAIPWLYKPQPPKGSRGKTRKKRQARARQPQSS